MEGGIASETGMRREIKSTSPPLPPSPVSPTSFGNSITENGQLANDSNPNTSGSSSGEEEQQNGPLKSVPDKSDKLADEVRGRLNLSLEPPSLASLTSAASSGQKRPMNAFLIFCKRHRSVVKAKHPHLENRSITKILGEWWAALDGDQKSQYTELARQYKEAFMKANPHFKWYKTDIRPPSPNHNQGANPPPPPSSFSSSSIGTSGSTNISSATSGAQLPAVVNKSPSPPISQASTTPKPPKKRYLELMENGGFNGSVSKSNGSGAMNTTPIVTSVPQEKAKPKLVSGPPILDIETMNRVIESAFSSEKVQSGLGRSEKLLENSMGKKPVNTGPTTNPTPTPSDKLKSNLEAEFPLMKGQHKKQIYNTATISPTKIITSSGPITTAASNLSSVSQSNDMPLNLSSSKTLHTSNQRIIDHFIDKLLDNAASGKPMPVEMLHESSSSTPLSSRSSDSKKEEGKNGGSCKGKRYLDIVSEKQTSGKRNKYNLTQSNGGGQTSIVKGNGNGTSKWISEECDLEKKITALPQLEQHLKGALNHSSSTRKIVNGETCNSMMSNFGGVDGEERELIIDTQKKESSDGSDCSEGEVVANRLSATSLNRCSPIQLEEDGEKFKSSLRKETGMDEGKPSTSTTTTGFTSHAIACDGLVALAEVALQQAHRNGT